MLDRNKNIDRRILKNLSWLTLSGATSKGLFFIGTIYLARHLGVENFGLFTLAQITICYIWIGADLGTYTYGIREISRNRGNFGKTFDALLTIKIVFGLIFFLMYSVTICYFLTDLEWMQKLTYIGCGLYLITYAFYIDWFFRGLEKFDILVWVSFVSSLLFLIIVFILVERPNDAFIAGFGWSVSFLVGGITFFLIARFKLKLEYRPIISFAQWKHHLKQSLPFAIAGGLSMLYNYIPVFSVNYFGTKYDVGLFAAAYRIISLLSAPGYYIAGAVFPVTSDLYISEREQFNRAGRRLLVVNGILGGLIVVLGLILGDEVITFLYGNEYLESKFLLEILIYLIPLQYMRYRFTALICATEYQKLQIFPISFAIVSFIVILFLISYTLKHVALASLASEFVVVSSYYFVSKRTYAKRT
jgi:O-antigen/teichoic acid export membrane protein